MAGYDHEHLLTQNEARLFPVGIDRGNWLYADLRRRCGLMGDEDFAEDEAWLLEQVPGAGGGDTVVSGKDTAAEAVSKLEDDAQPKEAPGDESVGDPAYATLLGLPSVSHG